MLRYLLDTNIVIDVIKRRPPQALQQFNQHAGRMAISAITLAELLHGAERSGDSSANLAVVEDFAAVSKSCRTCCGPRSTMARSGLRWSAWAPPSV